MDYEEFTRWVADQIFFKGVEDECFAELACRKLVKLGLVEAVGDEYIYITTDNTEGEQT